MDSTKHTALLPKYCNEVHMDVDEGLANIKRMGQTDLIRSGFNHIWYVDESVD
ncbi:hypothetical protein O9993_00010 [Vibrio lentus]|nr:hypothetical protein [Vibrio lentus]